jgi:acetolactate synthase small subunit
MNQKTKYIFLNIITFFLILTYVWNDQKIRNKFKNKKIELEALNIKLTTQDISLDEIQEIRKNFIQEQKELNQIKISGEQLLQEIERLKNLARSMDMKLTKLTIDPRNTFPSGSDLYKNSKIDIARQTLNFQISGNFLDIGVFIETIEEKSEKLKLQQCSITLDSLDPRGVLARIEYLTYGALN